MTDALTAPTDDRNFRLAGDVRPLRYQFHLQLDLEAKTFRGTGTLELRVAKATHTIVLHGIALEVARAELGGMKPDSIRTNVVSETLTLHFPRELPAGEAALQIEWMGRFTDGLRGLYLAKGIAATQFETADARRVFPCFDEPAFKATWALSVTVPQGVTALSNGVVTSDMVENGVRTVRFAETRLLSSYLIALVVGPLVGSTEERFGKVPVRTWSVAEKGHLTRFGQDAALAALPRLEEYFGLPYAYGKVDQAGIPDFEAGAMENAGLITYREIVLLLDPKMAPLSVKKRVAEVVTHELAHQWFGNWVTMVWWDDLWLNEAFATWMAYKIVDAWQPEWRVWHDFNSGKAAALHLDALKSTHPVRGVVRNAAEAGENFDLITYEKGGAVLRMIEGFLGEARFRDGIRLYMKRHAEANATADDLWGALAESSSQPVVKLANSWIRQSGYPLVSVAVKGSKVTLTQSRFYSEPGASSDETWPVPVVLGYGVRGERREHRVLFEGTTLTVDLGETPDFVCGNQENTGFYRVAYDAPALVQLAANLRSLSSAERISLLSDLWALVRAGRAQVGALLDLIAKFGDETDDAVLDELVGRLSFIEQVLTDVGSAPKFRAFVAQLFSKQLEELGWVPRPDEDHHQKLRRAALVRALSAVAREDSAVREAQARVRRILGGDSSALIPNLLDVATFVAARAGDATLFDTFATRFATEADPASQRRFITALPAFEISPLAARARDLFFSGAIPTQESSTFVSGLLGNVAMRTDNWRTVRDRWPEVIARTGGAPMLVRRVVEALGALREAELAGQVREHLSRLELADARQAIAQTLEKLSQDVALRERCAPEVNAWVSARRPG